MAEHASETTETPQRNIDDLRPGLITVVGLVTTILVVVIMVCTHAWFNAQEQALAAQASWGARPMQYKQYVADQQAQRQQMQWVDQDQTRVSIPVDRAMDIYLKNHVKSDKTEP